MPSTLLARADEVIEWSFSAAVRMSLMAQDVGSRRRIISVAIGELRTWTGRWPQANMARVTQSEHRPAFHIAIAKRLRAPIKGLV